MASDQGFDRLVNFGDAVVAISITLLVVPLVELHTDAPNQGVAWIVRHHKFEVFSFFLSFAVIASFWLVHHRLLDHAARYDDRVKTLQMLWLGGIAFLPFPTAMLGVSGNGRAETALYTVTLLWVSVCLALLHRHILHTPSLWVDEHAGPPPVTEAQLWVGSGLLVIALILVLAVPSIGAWALLTLLLTGPIETFLGRRARASSTA